MTAWTPLQHMKAISRPVPQRTNTGKGNENKERINPDGQLGKMLSVPEAGAAGASHLCGLPEEGQRALRFQNTDLRGLSYAGAAGGTPVPGSGQVAKT